MSLFSKAKSKRPISEVQRLSGIAKDRSVGTFDRQGAAKELSELRMPEAWAALVTLFDEDDENLYYYASQALGELGEDAPLKAIEDERSRVRTHAATALGDIGGGRAEGALIRHLENDDDYYVRLRCAEALMQFGGEAAARALTPYLLGERESGIQEEVIDEITEKHLWASEPLLSLLRAKPVHGNMYERLRNAVRAVASAEMVPKLIEVISEGDSGAQTIAAEVLGELGDPAARPVLTQLMETAQETDVRKAAAEALQSIGEDVASPSEARVDVIAKAASHDAPPEVVAALTGDGDVDALIAAAKFKDGTPLMWAALQGLETVAARLIELGADVNAVHSTGSTALMYAANKGHLEAMLVLLKADAEVNTKPTSALTMASLEGEIDVARVLLEHGADPNHNSGAPLVAASLHRRLELMRMLLDAGADPGIDHQDGATPLMFVFQTTTMAGVAIVPDDAEARAATEMLLKAGASPNGANQFGQTALMLAARLGLVGSVRALLEVGADTSPTDEDGLTALDHAKRSGNELVITLLSQP